MGEWKELLLGNVVTFQRGFDITKASQKDGVIPVVSSSGVNSFHFESKVKGPGVVIGRKGTLGTVFYFENEFWPHDTTLWVKDFHNNHPKFIYYFLKEFHFENYDVGTSNPTLNRNHIHLIPTKIPEVDEQNIVAEVLSSLDDKIDLLHRQNKTLEQLAETMFRQWFVEESEESWEQIMFGDLVKPKKGKNLTKSEAVNGEFPVVAGGLEPSCYHNEANTKSPVITVSASGANAGFVRLYHTPVWSSDSSYIDATITPYVYFSYVFLKVNQRQLTDKQEGSAQPHIYPSHIMELDMLNYPEILIEEFEKQVTPMFQKIKSNSQQIRTLTQLRDWLLPRLMSGDVKVNF